MQPAFELVVVGSGPGGGVAAYVWKSGQTGTLAVEGKVYSKPSRITPIDLVMDSSPWMCSCGMGKDHRPGAAPAAVDSANYQPGFFPPSEYQVLDVPMDLLIPADDAPRAQEVGVGYDIDTVRLHSPAAVQQARGEGLAQADRAALLSPDHNQRAAAMDRCAAEPFFLSFQLLTVEAFALSAAGQRFFGYRGNTALAEFLGCRPTDTH